MDKEATRTIMVRVASSNVSVIANAERRLDALANRVPVEFWRSEAFSVHSFKLMTSKHTLKGLASLFFS